MSDIDRAFGMLELLGVPRERARTVDNGIQVLATRYDKEIQCLSNEIADLRGFIKGMKLHVAAAAMYGIKTDDPKPWCDDCQGEHDPGGPLCGRTSDEAGAVQGRGAFTDHERTG